MFEIHSAHEQQVEFQNLPRPSVHPDSSIKPEENSFTGFSHQSGVFNCGLHTKIHYSVRIMTKFF